MAQLVRHRFDVEDYQRMAEAGVLGEDDRVELLEGEIVEMTPIGIRHAACVKRLNALFADRLTGRAIVGVQDPVRLDAWSEPQPDLVVLRTRADFYAGAHPGPEDVLLLIEVADTSAAADRLYKVPLYAAAGIVEVWLVDLAAGVVEVSTGPAGRGYGQVREARTGDHLAPAAFPDLSLSDRRPADLTAERQRPTSWASITRGRRRPGSA